MRAIILTGVSAASSKRRATLLRPSIDVILFAHFSRGAKNKRAFNESSRRPSQRSPTPNSSSQRAVARSIGGRLSDSKRLARDSRNLSTVSAARLACGVKSPRLFVTSASFSENNKRICSVGHVLAAQSEISDDFVSCGGGDLVLASFSFGFFEIAVRSDNRWNNLPVGWHVFLNTADPACKIH